MKGFVVFVLFALCGVAIGSPSEEKYPTKYDSIDLDGILKNDRLLRHYIDCILGKVEPKKCPREAEELKKYLRDAIQNKCEKCSESQKNGSKKVIVYLAKNKREWWTELKAVFDPEGKYTAIYSKEYKVEGVDF